ncbi:uncharacterized protein RJT21DRAFT_118405 [Scheffersomyces amazonensis]|uniref:uncharacterized protein n=1 Tax=Scheffersomyces amazonensis TaxID=1078765 RepID=UPI00315C711F
MSGAATHLAIIFVLLHAAAKSSNSINWTHLFEIGDAAREPRDTTTNIGKNFRSVNFIPWHIMIIPHSYIES